MKTITLNDGMECFVDDADFDEISKYDWKAIFSNRCWSAARSESYLDDKGKYRFRLIFMHRVIMNCEKGDTLRHIDNNKLNNQKHNLVKNGGHWERTGKQNRDPDRESAYFGVRWDKVRTRWEAYDSRTGELIGRCATDENAAKEYDIHMLSTYADESVLNFPLETYNRLIDKIVDPQERAVVITNLVCAKCGEEYPVTNFYRHPDNRGHRDCYCKKCRADYAKEDAKNRRKLIRDKVIELKAVPCADCHVQYPHYVQLFHHIDPAQKDRDVAQCKSMKQLLREVAKCVVLCANCHQEREWGEGGLSRMRFDKTYTV